MSRHVMMMGKCTRWATSGRRNIWVPSAPAPAMEDSRCVMDYVKNVKVQILCMSTFFGMCLRLCSVVYSHQNCVQSLLSRCLFVHTNLSILPFRAGAVRTAEGQEDRLMWMPTSFNLYVQMPSTGTEKTLYVNWSVLLQVLLLIFCSKNKTSQ